MIRAVTAAQMRELDRLTIEEIGIPGAVLMETAGRRIAETAVELTDGCGRIAAVCGGGNNGGDGFVCARVLRELGFDAAVYLVAPEASIGGDAALHLAAYRQSGGVVVGIEDGARLAAEAASIESADIVIDAVFGTGLARSVEGHYAAVVELINRTGGAVVSADIPSGLSADTGHALGVAVTADITVTMAFAKVGLVGDPGFTATGQLRIAEIGIPALLADRLGVNAGLLEAADASAMLPPLDARDHKGRRGHLLVVAGSAGKRGAARLCTLAGLRAGAGLVSLASGDGAEVEVPDPVMSVATENLPDLVEGRDAIALGPGFPTDADGKRLVLEIVEAAAAPMVIDADGLNHLVGKLDSIAAVDVPVALTPHPGEAARLLGISTAEVQRDRLGSARAIAERSGAVCLLKGARTVICEPGGFAAISPTGNPGMATAGAGDVLTGVIGGLLAQGLDAACAAQVGAYVHGLAGDIASDSIGPRSITALDISSALGPALTRLG